IVKRPTSASSTSGNSCCPTTINQRARSNSSSASIPLGRQTPITSRSSLKTKSNKQINNSNSTKSSVPSISTQSYLLGNVDLDDEDDLLTKYQ
ncbi:unnamed protein product, partial [Rotaria sp. Silwood2]